MARVIAESHHERWNGGGYPNGLRGDAIPIEGRIVTVCDVFDALTHERPYKPAWTIDQAIDELLVQRGKFFDARLVDLFLDQVVPDLAAAGVRLSDWDSLDDDDRVYLVEVFHRQIFPVLTPLAVDPGHPFPYISNLSLNLFLRVGDPVSGEERVARVKVPPLLPRFIVMPDNERFVPLEQVISAHLGTLFPDMTIGPHFAFRVTRNADLSLEADEADDLLVAVELELRRRRFGRSVRLELEAGAPDDIRELLLSELKLKSEDLYTSTAPLDLSGLFLVSALDRPDLREEAWAPMTPPPLANAGNEPADLFAVLRERDILVHHPYDSFTTTVQRMVEEATLPPRCSGSR